MQNLRNTQQQLVAAGWIEQIQLLEKGIFNVSIRQNNQIHNWRVEVYKRSFFRKLAITINSTIKW